MFLVTCSLLVFVLCFRYCLEYLTKFGIRNLLAFVLLLRVNYFHILFDPI